MLKNIKKIEEIWKLNSNYVTLYEISGIVQPE